MGADERKSRAARAPGEEAANQEPVVGPRVGWLVEGGVEGVRVDFEGNLRGPLPARSTVPLTAEELREAISARRGVVLLFENGDTALPLVVGLLREVSATPLTDAILEGTAPEGPMEALVDGQPRELELEAREEIVLRCGQASITLKKDGKVLIRGVQVETRASGTNRIRGGAVRIN